MRWHLIRYWAGSKLIIAGMRIMPTGRVKSELYHLIDCWATKVRCSIETEDRR